MSINHLNIQNKQTGDKLSAAEFNSTTSKINEVVDGVNASATGGKIGNNGEPLTKDSNGRIIIPLATLSSSGAMSASDKSKLDSINPSGGTGDYVDSISNEASYTANDMYDTASEFYGTNHKINTRSISYTTSDGSTHTFTHLDTVYKVATPSTTAGGTTISGKAGLMSAQDKQKLDMMPRPSDITSALSGKANKQIIVLVTRTQQGSTYVYSASKTFDEISTAIGNGTNVILQYDGKYYHISYSTRDYIVFTRFLDDAYMYSSIEVSAHDEWSYSLFILQEELTIDSTPTSGSSNPISSGGVYNALSSNFKTVNGEQLQGSGNVQTQQLVHFLETNGDWTCEWVFEDMISAFSAGVSLRGVIELSGNSYFSEVTESRDNFIRFTWIIPSESGTAPYSIYNQSLLVLEAQEISTGDDMVTTVIYQRFNKPILTPTDLRAVAFSGSYSDLSDTPTFKTINGNSIVGSGSVTIDSSMIPYVSQDSHADFQGRTLDEVLNMLDDGKQDSLTFDTTPTQNSTKPVTSGGVFSALRYDGNSINYVAQDDGFSDCIESLDSELANKQDTLVSGTNIKTVNGQSIVGSGNVAIQIPPAPPEPLLVYMTESGGTYSLDQEVFDIEDALSNDDSLECYLVWDGNNPAVVRLRCYGYNVEETIGGHSQSCIVWSGLDNIGNRHIVKAYHDSTNDVDVVNYSVASPDGRGITSIVKTATVGLVDTYTITYSDGTTSTYTVTNGRDGADGADGANGVSLGDVEIADNLTTDDATKVLSARQGKRLKDMIDNLGTLDSEDTGLAEVTLNIKFSLIQNLTDLTSSVDADTVNFGDALTVTLTAESGYTVGTCMVTMGGVNITSTAYSNNVVYIAEVTGDVVITAAAAEAGNIPIQFADTAVEAIILANTTHANPSYITEEEALLVTQIGSGYSQGSWFKGNTEITSFDELGKFGVTSLYEGAFNGCSALESIDISKISALTTRDNMGATFQNCTSLKKIKTSNALTTIPINCFRDCSSLALVDLGESVVTLKASILLNAPVTTIVMRSTTPPNYEYTWKKRGAKLYVPDEAFDTYQSSAWATTGGYGATADSYGTQMLKLSDYVEE